MILMSFQQKDDVHIVGLSDSATSTEVCPEMPSHHCPDDLGLVVRLVIFIHMFVIPSN